MSFARHRPTSYLALAVAVALGLSACSSSTPASSPKERSATSAVPTGNSAAALFQQMKANGAAAKSVHVKGAQTNGATATSKAVTARIDIAGDLSGKNYKAIVNDGNGVLELLTVAGKIYKKGDAAYYTKSYSAAAAKALAGRYTVLSAESAAQMGIPTVGKLLDQIYAAAAGNLSDKVVKTTVNGVPAYLLTSKTNDTKIYVSADGHTRLLQVVGTKGQKSTWDFTQWDAVPAVSAPAADQLNTMPSK